MRDKALIAAPRELDRPLVLSHPRGLQSHDSSLKILPPTPKPYRHCERCLHRVAIHKKADSSFKAMDRRADKSARDDREKTDSS